jgi:cardiolipin synthase (CMP-forming)
MTIPNFITIGRLLLVPLAVLMIGQGRWVAAFSIFIVAGVSDAVDGFLAKRFGMASELGAYLDPVADKALIVAIYVTLAIGGIIPAWLTILVVSRDIIIISGVILSWLMEKPVEMAPFIVSKLNTAAQIGFAALVLGMKAFGTDLGAGFNVAATVVAVLTLASMGAYLAFWLKHMAA